MSQLNEILERLASIQLTMSIPGVGQVMTAYPYLPADPASAQCPFFVNEVTGGPVKVFAVTGMIDVTSIITMSLCVARIESDSTQATVLQAVAKYRDVVLSTLASKIRFGNDLPYIKQTYISNWGGLGVIEYGSTRFGGLMFELTVQELYSVTIQA